MKIKRIITSTCIVATASFLTSAVLARSPIEDKKIDLSAFVNFKKNLNSINSKNNVSKEELDEAPTDQIVSVIDREIANEISRSYGEFKTHAPPMVVAKLKTRKDENIKAVVGQEELDRFMLNKDDVVAEIKTNYLPKKYKTFGDMDLEQFTKNEIKPIAVVKKEDLERFEIRNSEDDLLKRINLDKKSFKTFESLIDEKLLSDEVATGQSSTQNVLTAPIEADEVRTIQHSTKKEEDIKLDDLIMYDYSKKENVGMSIQKLQTQKPLSNSVLSAIHREMDQAPATKSLLNTPKEQKPQEAFELSDDAVVFDYTQPQKPSLNVENEETFSLEAPKSTQFKLRAKEVLIDQHIMKSISGFDFLPDIDRAERVSDNTTGEIDLEYSLSGEGNVQTGIIETRGAITTRVELNLNTQKGLIVPVINEDSMNRFLQNQGVEIEGAMVMINLNDNIKDVEVEGGYQKKWWLDQNFKINQTREKARFVLIAGLKSGNTILKYLLSNLELAQKIIYVGEGEVYFEDPGFESSIRENFELFTRNVLATKKKELVLNASELVFFNTSTAAKRRTLNSYEMKIPTLPYGMRKYLDIKSFKQNVFVGSQENPKLEIPTMEFMEKILEKNNMTSLDEKCMVQLNLSRELRDIKVGGKNRSGEMYIQQGYADGDGNFSEDNGELAEKIFLSGDIGGLVNVRLEYSDGSHQFLKTYCTEGTYLIEQL